MSACVSILMLFGLIYLPGPTLDVHFQKGFYGQRVSLAVDNCIVFENKVLVSNRILDLAGSASVREGVIHRVMDDKPSSNCFIPYSQFVTIKIVLDGRYFERKFDLREGSFIGIVNAGGAPYYIQSEDPFLYD